MRLSKALASAILCGVLAATAVGGAVAAAGFTQPAAGDWDSVIGRVVVELSRMAAEKAQSWTSRVPDSR